ncbi:hypothetical protein K8089_13395 [Aequorivita sp. F47161]|uniref:Outer membrane protein beta-barrel domain-containing protein n=1 Tax=Aequorivita vitellina TaxID=2874475 RepID=A0A9X1U3Y3_9FLAO|nr:hypothetical protein [Aequorivita vitellina]MCG2420018.1 hypothetical protein [Aequorivita vitellina]MCZ4317969.1 hypothetical protein [Aequorivita viscosa]
MKSLLSITLLLFCITGFAQEVTVTQTTERSESIKPLRIGTKLGIPSLITLNAEYVTPLLDERVAATLDFISLSKTVDDVSVKYNNFEFGANVYLKETGKGLYASLTYLSFKSTGTFEDVDYDDGSFGPGTAKIDFSTVNFKVGAKLGRVFYFRAELGYGFGKIPETVVVNSNNSAATAEEDIPAIPGMSSSGTVIFNIGFGFGFL